MENDILLSVNLKHNYSQFDELGFGEDEELVGKRYYLEDALARGAFARVYQACNVRSYEKVAIKQVR